MEQQETGGRRPTSGADGAWRRCRFPRHVCALHDQRAASIAAAEKRGGEGSGTYLQSRWRLDSTDTTRCVRRGRAPGAPRRPRRVVSVAENVNGSSYLTVGPRCTPLHLNRR
jgi:hypothetical protein